MIWVIGDIHGMFDPLRRLLAAIERGHHCGLKGGNIEKLIFMGDYIDYGPSSKEVIDYLLDLPYEKVFLMGNHDDLLLQFLDNSDLFQKYGNVWFRGNGGQKTVTSFMPEKFFERDTEDFSPQEFRLDQKYLDFFRNLRCAHKETIAGRKFAFLHAGPNKEHDLEEQLALNSYEEFHKWRREKKIWIEDTPLWIRAEPVKKFGDYAIVHGHTPTPNLENAWKNLHGYSVALELPFFKFEEKEDEEPVIFQDDGYRTYRYSGTLDRLISINTDTGAVYGARLTAVGLDEEFLNSDKIVAYQVLIKEAYRSESEFQTVNFNFDS